MKSINPATEEIIAEYPEHSWEQIEAACAAAKEAFRSWRKTPLAQRCDLLRRAASVLRERRSTLAPLMTSEMGKTIAASEGEIDKCVFGCEYFAQQRRGFWRRSRCYQMRRAVMFDSILLASSWRSCRGIFRSGKCCDLRFRRWPPATRFC